MTMFPAIVPDENGQPYVVWTNVAPEKLAPVPAYPIDPPKIEGTEVTKDVQGREASS